MLVLIINFGFNELLSALKLNFSDSGRSNLYKEALDLFAEYPLFGVGLGYTNPSSLNDNALMLYNFHSVFFHVLGTMGIMGIISYIFYFLARFRILMKNNSVSSLFLTIAFIMFECYAFIDTAEFNAIPLMSTVTVLITVVELTNKKSNGMPLPLTENRKNNIIL